MIGKYQEGCKRFITWITLITFALQPALAAAQVITDPGAPGQKKPVIETTANGLPIVQIATPSGAGVSHNLYLQFDIDPSGLILNNSRALTSTQLAGYVMGNPNLSGGPARIILNEVTGANVSRLNGYLEVAGQRADVIIANPNGIYGDGFGFINTGRTVLTTGTPVFGGSGSLDAFRVTGGQVSIEGAGMDAGATDRAEIISRAVVVNAGIWAKELHVVTGANQVGYTGLDTQPIAGDAVRPTVALDVGALGGMYAHKILLVGTEAGVGVNSQGTLSAYDGDLTLTNEGKIINAGQISAAGSIRITTQDSLSNQGTVYAQDNTSINADGVDNSGLMAAAQNASVAGRTVSSTGVLGAGIQNDGTVGGSGDLTITATGAVAAKGRNLAGGKLTVTGASIDQSGALAYAGGAASFTATNGDLDHTGATTQVGGALAISAAGTLKNDQDVTGNTGRIQADAVTVTAHNISNKGGSILQTGTTATILNTGGGIDNSGGTIAGNGAISLTAGDLVNQGGTIQATGTAAVDLGITVGGAIDNGMRDGRAGIIAASGNVSIAAGSLQNTQGQVTAGQALNVGVSQDIVNSQGLLAANGNVSVSGARIDNTQGTIGSVYGQTGVTATAGPLDNTAGYIEAAQAVTVSAVGLNNTEGVMAGESLRANSNTQKLDNTRGKLVATAGTADIQSGSLINEAGLIQATGTLTIDTHGQSLDNTNSGTQGGIVGQNDVRLDTGDLNNRAGHVFSGGTLVTRSAAIDNTQGGLITGTARLDIGANTLHNQGGQIQALENMDIILSDTLDNTGGLICSDRTLSASAATITNTGTLGKNQGIEGQSVGLTAARINNRQGAVRADAVLILTGGDYIDNSQGMISSGQTLTLQDTVLAGRTLRITNTGGTLLAGQQLSIDGAGLTGDGKLLSQGDLSIKLTQDYKNSGQLQADGSVRLETTGTLTNQSLLRAGESLDINAANIENTGDGKIGAQNTTVVTAGILTNRGLIDGGETLVTAGTLTNLGTGLIYGDHLAIQANTLTNDMENDKSPAIAARARLDLGAQTITNREHSLIFSMGDMAIGGSLDAGRQATGQAAALYNQSATIEALGNLSLAVRQISNTNEHFSTYTQTTGTEDIVEYQGSGSPNRYLPDTPDVYIYRDESLHLHTPEGNYESWLSYNYTRTTTETKVLTSDPAQILSGGAMHINADTLTNDKSSIIAGGTLSGNIGTLDNTEVPGERVITDSGSVTSYWRDHHTGTDSTGHSTADYKPPAIIQEITLTPTIYKEKAASTGSGTQVPALTGGSVDQVPAGANPANATNNGGAVVSPVTQVVQAGGTVVSSGGVNTGIPNNSLYTVNPDPHSHYLVETDPRFADYRQWLSSDYMLQVLSLDPSAVQKRLGDGFYEQQLIREQVAQLTGRRFLDGYVSDEEQYRALMNNGATFAQEYQLTVGVALSADQMAQLTSDIIWLVEKDVLLPDGQTVRALVPQLYVRGVQNGELSASGALIAGDNVRLALSGDLTNSGTIAGNNVVSLTAGNIRNVGGRINGNDIGLQARTDLDNIGGRIEAVNSLAISAGRDLNVVSTTGTQTNLQGSRTNINRVGGLYVTGDDGLLAVNAGRDLNLLAAQIGNSGPGGETILAAGRDLNLGIVTEGASNYLVWDKKNKRSDSTRSDVGTMIQAQGDIRLQAGNDINAKAAGVESSQGALLATAGRDVTLTAGETYRFVDEAHQHKGKSGMLSSKTYITRDILAETTAQAATLSGDTATVLAGRDITVQGSNVVATHDVNLAAQGNITVGAARETSQEEHLRQVKTSGLFSGGGFGFTIGSKSEKTTLDGQTVTQAGSTIGSVGGQVSITSGLDTHITGSDIIGTQGINVLARNITIDAAQETARNKTTYEFKQSGLSVSLGGGIIDTAQNLINYSQRAGEVSDSRLQALYGYKAAKEIKDLGQALKKGDLKKDVSLNVSIGSSKFKSETVTAETFARGSTLTSDEDINLTATGSGAQTSDGKAADGDVNIIASTVTGQNVSITAAKDVNLQSAENTYQSNTKSGGSSFGVGWSFGANPGLFIQGGKSSGKAGGTGTTHTPTLVTARDTLTIISGNDTNIIGAQARGDTVNLNVGRNLNIASLQDMETYNEHNSSGGFNIGFGHGMSSTGSFSTGKMNSDYRSVTDQAGIYVGQGGFNINVAGNTDLKGAVIASEATPDKNRLSTGTLTWSDIENKADYKASSIGVSYSSKKDTKNNITKGVSPDIGVPASGDASSTTHSAISPGEIIVGGVKVDPTISRNTENAVNALGKIFNKKTVQEQQELAKLFGEEAYKLVGDIAEKNHWKEGSPEKIALHALVGGIMADLGGSSFTSGAVGAGLSQAVQGQLANIKDPGLRLIASALVGAAAAKIAGGNALAGASTAISGTKYNDYHHRTFKEGEIVYKDGKWYVYKDGKDVPIEKPTQYGIIVLIENKDDPDNGWDYVLWNGSKDDTYFPGTIGSQYITVDSSGKQSMAYVNVFDSTGVLGNLNPIVDETNRIGLANAMTPAATIRALTTTESIKWDIRQFGRAAPGYILDSTEQAIFGNWTNKVTILGTAGQVGLGFTGLDFLADARDIDYDFKTWEWSWSHAGQTAVDTVGLLPIIGGLKYTDEVGTLIKSGEKTTESVIEGANTVGQWVKVNESMSDASRAYQRYITGSDEVWLQNGVKFDGLKNGTLIEAKGSYANFIDNNTGTFHEWFSGQQGLIKQANSQIRASGGMPINWYFSDTASINATQLLFQREGITGINLIFKPLE